MIPMIIRKHIRSVSVVSSAMTDLNRKYEEAVKTLNTLQSNAQAIERIRKERSKYVHLNIPKMIKYAERAGMSLDDIDRLSVIHVSGTKGKGSTCAYCESILRHQGFKTGFFSSPHLVEVRERFRINGSPLSREKFTSYFWDVYNKLDATKIYNDGAMPAYFSFLTIMAFHVFMQERTDVAIIEVGIGGQYDSTNLIRKPVVCGVTSLGLDHISILGNTIEKIAWNKAGIFKPEVPAITVQQVPSALQVLKDRAEEIGNTLYICPSLNSFDTQGKAVHLGITGSVQRTNAALALHLCKVWMESTKRTGGGDCTVNGTSNGHVLNGFTLNDDHLKGLLECSWPGRNQTIQKTGITYYLDGAHTLESIEQCVEWFEEASRKERQLLRGKVLKMILYNTTGDRDPKSLLSPFGECEFDAAVFCPNMIFPAVTTADQTNNTVTKESQMHKVDINSEAWKSVFTSKKVVFIDSSSPSNVSTSGTSTIGGDTLKTENDSEMEPVSKKQMLNHAAGNTSESTDHIHSAKVNGYFGSQSGENHPSHSLVYPSASLNQSESTMHVSSNRDHSQPSMQMNVTTENSLKEDCNRVMVVKKFSSIFDSLLWISQGKDDMIKNGFLNSDFELSDILQDADHIQVLITGSLHLVGGVLRVVDPTYN